MTWNDCSEDEAALAGKQFDAVDRARRTVGEIGRHRTTKSLDADLIKFINRGRKQRRLLSGKKGPGMFAYLQSLRGLNGGRDRRDVIATVFRGLSDRMESGYLLRDVINLVDGIHFGSSAEIHTLSRSLRRILREMRDAAGDSGEFYTPRSVIRFMVKVVDPKLGEVVLDPATGTGGFLAEAYTHLAAQADTVQKRRILQKSSLRGVEPKTLPFMLAQMNLLFHGLEAPQIDPGNALRFRIAEIGERDRVDVILTNPPFGGEEEGGILTNFPEDRRTVETALLFLQLIMRRLKRAGRGRAGVVVPNGTLFGDGVAARIKGDLLSQFNLHTIVRLPEGVFSPYADVATNLLFFDTTGPTDEIWYWEHQAPEGRRRYSKTQPLQYEELATCLDWWKNRADGSQAWKVRAADILQRDQDGTIISANLDIKNPHAKVTDHRDPAEIVSSAIAKTNELLTALEGIKGIVVDGAISGSGWPRAALAELLIRNQDWINIDPDIDYRQVTVKLWGNGVVLRTTVKGSEIAATSQIRVAARQFIMSRIDARHGAFGLIPKNLDGAVVSQDFPVFTLQEDRLRPEFLNWISKTEWFVNLCRRASEGSTNRVRLKDDRFLQQEIPLPSVGVQDQLIAILDRVAAARGVSAAGTEEIDHLLAAMLSRIS